MKFDRDKEYEKFVKFYDLHKNKVLPKPKIEEILNVGIIPYSSSNQWGNVYLNFRCGDRIYNKLIDFKHFNMRVFWQPLPMEFDYFFYNATNKINVSNHHVVLNGDYDQVKITPIKYREKLGLASIILKQMIDEG